MDSAVIFDVDGVLLELTPGEEDVFFAPFEMRYGLKGLSRDWDSYRSRNDEDIIAEILEKNKLPTCHKNDVIADYIAIMDSKLADQTLKPVEIPGIRSLLAETRLVSRLGIATANLIDVARLRLARAGLWHHVSAYPFGAEGGGHKRVTLARAVAATGLAKDRIVYIGDNLNDVDAGLSNGVHFIGFTRNDVRREKLKSAGARHVSGDHQTTLALIGLLLGRVS